MDDELGSMGAFRYGDKRTRTSITAARDLLTPFPAERRLPSDPKTPNMLNAPAGANSPAPFRPADPHYGLTMTLAARTVLVTLSAGMTVAILYAASVIRPTADVVMQPEPEPKSTHPAGIKGLPIGAAGCLGAACHGAPARATLNGEYTGATWQSSGSCWVAADPHTGAYSLLTDNPYRPVNVTARHIMDRYAPGKLATEDARCLACHSNPALADWDHKDARVRSLQAEGVNCEACHGNAGGWLRQHTTWTTGRDKGYPETGMVKLYDIGERTVSCAGCHVGAPEAPLGTLPDGRAVKLSVRDMNHDMIAAGHPRLNFDLAEYQRRLPRHWQEKDRIQQELNEAQNPPKKGIVPRGPDFELKAWLVGRVAHAEAACRLLESRAARAQDEKEERTPWPEFAEFNCAACHHALRGDPNAWRGAVLKDRSPGAPPWQAIWPVTPAIGLTPPQPPTIFTNPPATHEAAAHKAIADLVRDFQRVRPAAAKNVQPRATAAAAALRELRVELSAWPDEKFAGPADGVFGRLTDGARDFDSGLQVLFGLAVLERRRGAPDPDRNRLFGAAFRAYRAINDPEQARWPEIEKAIKTLRPMSK